MNTLRIPYDRGVRFVKTDEIVRVEALSNYSRIYFTSGYPMTVAKVLQWFETQLPDKLFSRVHRSHLVNKMHIDYISMDRSNTVLMRNGEIIEMSRRRKAQLKSVKKNNI